MSDFDYLHFRVPRKTRQVIDRIAVERGSSLAAVCRDLIMTSPGYVAACHPGHPVGDGPLIEQMIEHARTITGRDPHGGRAESRVPPEYAADLPRQYLHVITSDFVGPHRVRHGLGIRGGVPALHIEFQSPSGEMGYVYTTQYCNKDTFILHLDSCPEGATECLVYVNG